MNTARLLSRTLDLLPFWARTRIRRVPGLAALQRRVVARLNGSAPFDHCISAGPARGLMFRVRLPEDKLYWAGHWESEITRVLASEAGRGKICYDVGGHRGFMAGVMALNGAREVHCFEPNPANIGQIGQLLTLNPQLPIKLHRCAVGSEDAEVDFEVMPDTAMGKLSNSNFQHDRGGTTRMTVQVNRLDTLIESAALPPAGLVKIDIEGAELDALRGAERLVETHKPVFLIEVHTHSLFEACSEWLRARRYTLAVIERPIGSLTPDNFRVCHLMARPKH
jgi:FkbM family methyltransferase